MANKDPDLHHIGYLQRTTLKTAYKPAYAYQQFTVFIGWVVSYLGLAILPNIKNLMDGTYYKIVPCVRDHPMLVVAEILHVLFSVCISLLPFVLFASTTKAWLFFIVPYAVHSMLFMLNSQITHLHTACMQSDKDWFKHQVLTSTNHGVGSWFHFIFSSGLNYQIEHHLFPNVNHCHHPYISPIVKRICAKHDVTYKEFGGYYDAFVSYFDHVKLMSKEHPE